MQVILVKQTWFLLIVISCFQLSKIIVLINAPVLKNGKLEAYECVSVSCQWYQNTKVVSGNRSLFLCLFYKLEDKQCYYTIISHYFELTCEKKKERKTGSHIQ